MKAFPRPASVITENEVSGDQSGMDLRDWFAGMALLGWLADGGAPDPWGTAKTAYEYADAMMEVREEEENG